LRSASDVASASNAFSASASTTSGAGEVRTTSRTNDAVAGCRVRPGPIATAWASPAALTTASTASGAIDPASVSGSGRKTASVSDAWTTGRIDAGSATTTAAPRASRPRDQPRGPGHRARPRDHDERPALLLVAVERTRWEDRRHVIRFGQPCAGRHRVLVEPDVDDPDRPASSAPGSNAAPTSRHRTSP
jgi:hypothetical protein